MSELQNISVFDNETSGLKDNHESSSPDNEQIIHSPEGVNEFVQQLMSSPCEFLQRQKGVEELLGRFLERQQGIENLLSQFLQRKQTSNNEVNITEMPRPIIKNQTVGGDENPASIYTTASDRAAGDIAAAHSLVRLRDPGGFGHDRSSVDLNPRLYHGTLTDESSRQCARSVEGATHASVRPQYK